MRPQTSRQHERHPGAGGQDAGAGDVLCYADQGSFVGLRALGRGPVLKLSWLYPHPLDEAAVSRFNEALAQGLLGRLLQRSPLPWGRHRWVASHVPAPVTWFRTPLPARPAGAWRTALQDLAVDPETGPSWRLAVQALDDGGCALSLLVSHTNADLLGTVQAIVDAAAGRPLEPDFPAPSRRWSVSMLARDGAESLRALPGVARAVAQLLRRPAGAARPPARGAMPPAPHPVNGPEPVVEVPFTRIVIDAAAYGRRSADFGVTGNTLLAALAARLAFRMGRMDSAGLVKLVLPVSDRQPGDRRGNALRPVTVMADPETCRSNPRALQRDMRGALARLLRHGDELSPLLPLLPYVPMRLARWLERVALGADLPVGCSLAGELPPEMMRPCGRAAELQISLLERYTASALAQLRGLMFLVGYRVDGAVVATVSAYAAGRVTTAGELASLAEEALADLGLEARPG